MRAKYDSIGEDYSEGRREDPRIAAFIRRAIGPCRTIVNVGAGAGSYEPAGRKVVSVEPSFTMIQQHPARRDSCVQARAEKLPFRDGAFDCAMAVLTIHHWSEVAKGLAELRRVARERVVLLTWDQEIWERFWLVSEYCPILAQYDRERAIAVSSITTELGPSRVIPVPVPHDCTDGFQGAFWRRPEAYLDPAVRRHMSGFARVPSDTYEEGLRQLEADLSDGSWRRRHSQLMETETLDLGYRLIVAEPNSSKRVALSADSQGLL